MKNNQNPKFIKIYYWKHCLLEKYRKIITDSNDLSRVLKDFLIIKDLHPFYTVNIRTEEEPWVITLINLKTQLVGKTNIYHILPEEIYEAKYKNL
jgi:hypothetical protein